MVRNDLIQEILQMDAADREYLRDVVLASLTDDLPPQLSPEDQKEILRRIEAYEASPAAYLPWSQVKAKLAEQRAGRSR